MNVNYDFNFYAVVEVRDIKRVSELSDFMLNKFLINYVTYKKKWWGVNKVEKLNEMVERYKVRYIVDSGGFFVKTYGLNLDVDGYIKWLKGLKVKPDFIFTLDSLDWKWTLENTKRIMGEVDYDVYFVIDVIWLLETRKWKRFEILKNMGVENFAIAGFSKKAMELRSFDVERVIGRVEKFKNEFEVKGLHLLGTKNLNLLFRVPFTSADEMVLWSFKGLNFIPKVIKELAKETYRVGEFSVKNKKGKFTQLAMLIRYFEETVREYWRRRLCS